MKYLVRGAESEAMVLALLKLTRITSENQIDAINDHLCKGHTVEIAAIFNGIKEQNLCRALSILDLKAGIAEEINELKKA